MINLDALQKQREDVIAKMNAAMKDGNEDAFAQHFTEFTDILQEAVLAEAKGFIQSNDNAILAGRGARVLTSQETSYYEKVIGAMKSADPKQELTLIDETLPKTVIDAVFEDITEDHPLLSEINFQNTGVLTEIVVSVLDGRHMATWGKLCDKIAKELLSGFDTIDLKQRKLSAFIPVCKAMLEIGPEWLDRYVRAILSEAIANGLEEGIIDGDGLDEPIGMRRDPNGAIDPATGYDELAPIPFNDFSPASVGAIISQLATGPNLLNRKVTEVIFIVNPVTYFNKIMPAITYQNADKVWVERVPFPIKFIQSVHMPQDEAIIGLGKRYFFGLGTGKGGKIEYSDHYHFLEDERVYLTKLYGNGRPLDGTSFILLDISNLRRARIAVDATVINEPLEIQGAVDATVTNEPLEIQGVADARLASLKIGALILDPPFNKSHMIYEVATDAATNTITAVAMDGEATINIDLNDGTTVPNGTAATWVQGETNKVIITVTSGEATEEYVVAVTHSS